MCRREVLAYNKNCMDKMWPCVLELHNTTKEFITVRINVHNAWFIMTTPNMYERIVSKWKKQFLDITQNKNLQKRNSKRTIWYVKILIYCQCLRRINDKMKSHYKIDVTSNSEIRCNESIMLKIFCWVFKTVKCRQKTFNQQLNFSSANKFSWN